MSELGEKREQFTRNLYLLLGKMYEKGYRPRFDIEHCKHMKNSLHYQGLAKDVLLFDSNNIYLSKTEGIIPAIESAHALSYAMKIAPTMGKDKIIVVNISGRGDKDVAAIARYMGVNLHD